MYDIGIIGGGAWGTALATAAIRAGSSTKIWAREKEVVESINRNNENKIFLPGVKLSENLKATSNLADIPECKTIILVTPSQFLRATCIQLKKGHLSPNTPLVICSKGIETGSLRLMSEVVTEILPNPLAVLTGPTFASEVAKGLPVFMTLACKDKNISDKIIKLLNSPSTKIIAIDDIIGAQIGGSVKNVIAIACGIVEGKGLGENLKAALITGGAREIGTLIRAKGGNPDTVTRLCGIGDLILTCNSRQSRNFSLGFELGQGKSIKQATEGKTSIAEGVESATSVTDLSRKLRVTLPICESVRQIIHHGENIDKIIKELINSY